MGEYIEISSNMVFLIVDDVASYREVMMHILKKLGFKNILQALDAPYALNVLRNEKVDFVISERSLKRCTGMEFLKEIRESPELERIPFMMMAGDISKEDIALASEFGVDGYLKKPFVINDVSQRLSNCMQRYADPENLENLFDKARRAYNAGQYDTALAQYQALQIKLPKSARVLTGMARSFRAMGDLSGAERLLKDAIAHNPLYVHAHHDLGLVYLQKDRTEQALECFSKAIDLSPGNPVRYESVADLLMNKERYEDAERYLMRAVKLELAYPALYAQIGKALFAQKKNDKAVEYFQKALREQPNNTSFINSLGICMKAVGRLEDAINYYNQALKQRPSDTKILFNKVLCLVGMKEWDRARKTCQQILKFEPTFEKARAKLQEIDKLEEAANDKKG
jgi:tetratricopeptide (TPR) repeat protein